MDLPVRARVVVIGGGVIGTSVAYHLGHLGWTDTVLVEQHMLTSGSTFHAAGLVDRYVLHLAPALMGDGQAALHLSTPTMADLWRGRIVSTRRLGDDLEVVLEPRRL